MADAAAPAGTPQPVQAWLNHIAAYDREFKKWGGRVDKILKKYRDETRPANGGSSRFNILWSNIATLVPATFSRLPQPVVSRRFRDNDPVGRVAALIIERGLDYEVQHYPDYHDSLEEAVKDRFLGGRGTAWVRYEPHIQAKAAALPAAGVQLSEDSSATAPEGETLAYECVPVDYVHWKDFGHTVARTWEEVTAVWRVVYMTRKALVERFGDEGKKIPLDAKPDELTKNQMASESEFSRAKIYEIWDITAKKALWLSKSQSTILDERADPLGLEGFWPCPKPLYATLTTDSLVPVPDFTIYQDQQATLDVLADRIDGLVRALRVRGVYDASQGVVLARLFTEGDNNDLLPIKNWAAFAEKNGLQGAISLVDLKPIAEALREAYLAMENVKGQVYELTGISDIIRGQGEASETATAQRLKGQYASLRLKSYQDEVARFATGLLQIKAQIMCAKFDEQTLSEIAAVDQLSAEDQALVPQAMALLKSGALRSFRVEIAADTLVQIDEQSEKEARTEFLAAVSGFMQKSMPMIEGAVQQGAYPLVGLIFELLKFGVTGYKVGKTIEGKFDASLDQLQKLLSQPKPAQPNPEMARVQAEQQTQAARIQSEQQTKAAAQQFEQFKLQSEQQAAAAEAQRAREMEQFKANLEAHAAARDHAFEQWKAKLENDTKIVVEEIRAKSALKTASLSANAKAAADGVPAGEFDGEGNMQPSNALQGVIDATNKSFQEILAGHTDNLRAEIQAALKTTKRVTLPDGRVAMIENVQGSVQ